MLKEMWTLFALSTDDRLFDAVLHLIEAEVSPNAIFEVLRNIKDRRVTDALQAGIVPPWETRET